MQTKYRIALLLALACCVCAGCQRQTEPMESNGDTSDGDIAGNDWRTWGLISDYGTITQEDGTQKTLLLCVFAEEAVLYEDDAIQTEFARLSYPYEIPDAAKAYTSFSLQDRNNDGKADVTLLFVYGDGAQTELLWYGDGSEFVAAPSQGGDEPTA